MVIIASIVNAILYRLGGIGRPFRSWMRDWLIPGVVILTLIGQVQAPWWAWVLSYPLMGGALTTYWDRFFILDNFYFHGFMIGLGLLPVVIWGDLGWNLFLMRSVVLGAAMGIWCDKFSNDWVEECGRGAFIGLTLPLLLLG